MEKKFNLYDLFGFGIPGAVLVFLLYGIGRELEMFPVVDGSIATSFGFLAISYVFGHVLLHFAKKRSPSKYHLSQTLLNDDDKNLHKVLKDSIKKIAADRLKIDFSKCTNDEERKNLNQATFELCYTCVIQQEKGFYTENFNALYGMCRSMVCVAYIALLYTVVFLCHRYNLDVCWGSLFIVLLTWFWLFIGDIFTNAWETYAKAFALSVYKAFYCYMVIDEKAKV